MKGILATTQSFLLALRGTMPWTLCDELKEVSKLDMDFFRQKTMGCDLVMGYKTWESLNKKPLKGRGIHYIITSKKLDSTDNIKYVHMEDFIKNYSNNDNLFCIGGASVYKQLLPLCDEIYWNEIVISDKCNRKLQNAFEHSSALFLHEQVQNTLRGAGDTFHRVKENVMLRVDENSVIVFHKLGDFSKNI